MVKEVLENSLDAGATRVDIDVEAGGSKLIRIRDNGGGMAPEDLPLALARHATSKIASLEDLERVGSLGFGRGPGQYRLGVPPHPDQQLVPMTAARAVAPPARAARWRCS